jgi:hypothetical protein
MIDPSNKNKGPWDGRRLVSGGLYSPRQILFSPISPGFLYAAQVLNLG